jgi:hypothetical protein
MTQELLPVGEIIRALRAHWKAGNRDVIRAVQRELGDAEKDRIEELRPVETIMPDALLADYLPPVNGFKRGKPQKVTAAVLIRVRAMLSNNWTLADCAKAVGVATRTLQEYVACDGTFKEPAMKRLRNEPRCVPIRSREKRKETHEAVENSQ